MSLQAGVPTTRLFKVVYVIITGAFVLAALGTLVAGVWVLALALGLMGGAMTAASTQMRVVSRTKRRPPTLGH